MKNLNSKEVLNKVANELPETSGAILVIAADGAQHVRTHLFGCDRMGMSPNCVAIATAMHDLLDGQLGIADSIYRRFKEDGSLVVQSKTNYEKFNKFEQDNEDEDEQPEKPENPADILHEMIDALFGGSVGGDNNEDDD